MTDKLISMPWDGPGLTPRTWKDRCSSHGGFCAYDDRDVSRCSKCHASHDSGHCTCKAERAFPLEQVRQWARSQGFTVTEKGRVPKEIMDSFLATQDTITEIDGQRVLA